MKLYVNQALALGNVSLSRIN